jgi:hypothetical protein
MRESLTAKTLETFMTALAQNSKVAARVYVVGGASAVLLGWREATIDLDIKIIPESDEILRTIPRLKETLKINVELASPDDFIPPLPGWQERSRFIQQVGRLSFYHYDFYAQDLAKLERRHELDLKDIANLFESRLIEANKLLELYSAIESELHRYLQVDAKSFRAAVEHAVEKYGSQ